MHLCQSCALNVQVRCGVRDTLRAKADPTKKASCCHACISSLSMTGTGLYHAVFE
jgi:hypothetical protein